MCFWFSCYTQAESINSSYCVWESSRRREGGWLWGESLYHHRCGFVFLFMCSLYSVWNKWEQAVRFYCYSKGNLLPPGQRIQAPNVSTIPATMLYHVFCICRWTMWTLLTLSGRRPFCSCWISPKEKKFLFWLRRRRMVSNGWMNHCSHHIDAKLNNKSLLFLFFSSLSEDSGIGRGWLLLHSDTFWIWEGVPVWAELQQGRGIPCSRHAVQWKVRLLARHSYWQEPSRSGTRHHS